MKRPESYHHGNLREALLAAADELLVEAGVEALTWREVARRAGVSPGAPYHHFADKAALIAALARRHLDELDQQFQSVTEMLSDPHEQLRELGMTYVTYALEHPAAFRLMFRPEKGSPFRDDPATEPVFRVVLRVVQACRTGARPSSIRDEHAALAAWSMVHGLAALLLDGPLATLASDRAQVRELVTASAALLDVTRAD